MPTYSFNPNQGEVSNLSAQDRLRQANADRMIQMTLANMQDARSAAGQTAAERLGYAQIAGNKDLATISGDYGLRGQELANQGQLGVEGMRGQNAVNLAGVTGKNAADVARINVGPQQSMANLAERQYLDVYNSPERQLQNYSKTAALKALKEAFGDTADVPNTLSTNNPVGSSTSALVKPTENNLPLGQGSYLPDVVSKTNPKIALTNDPERMIVGKDKNGNPSITNKIPVDKMVSNNNNTIGSTSNQQVAKLPKTLDFNYGDFTNDVSKGKTKSSIVDDTLKKQLIRSALGLGQDPIEQAKINRSVEDFTNPSAPLVRQQEQVNTGLKLLQGSPEYQIAITKLKSLSNMKGSDAGKNAKQIIDSIAALSSKFNIPENTVRDLLLNEMDIAVPEDNYGMFSGAPWRSEVQFRQQLGLPQRGLLEFR